MLRYSLVAIVYPPMCASSFWTIYRNGLGPLFLSLTKPQIVSIGLPSAFFLAARSQSSNSTEFGFSIFAAMVAFAGVVTDSSWGWEDGGVSIFAAMVGVVVPIRCRLFAATVRPGNTRRFECICCDRS